MKALHLASNLVLPLDIVTQKLGWLGVTGSGKTYGASKLAELLWAAGAQFVVLDVVGTWYGLRLAKDGKKPSAITVPVFGGLHGDVPLEPTAGALLADLIVDRTLSCTLDLSQFESDADKARFALAFADRFFFRKKAMPSAVHLFLEEAQELVPQNPQKGEERMLHAFTRLQKLGRNFGIGSSYISQRPQEVNKKALNMAQTLFVFRTTGTHERKAIESWIQDKALDQDIAGDLPKIPTGHCHVWSPEFLKISEMAHILPKETFDASATPEVGAGAVTRHLAPIDLAQVQRDMAATIEKAKADDPRELRKQIAALQKQVKANMPAVSSGVAIEQYDELRREMAEVRRENVSLRRHWESLASEIIGNVTLAEKAAGAIRRVVEKDGAGFATNGATEPASRRAAPVRPADTKPRDKLRDIDGDVTAPQQKILNAIAAFEPLGLDRISKSVAAIYAGVSPTSGGYFNNLGRLRAMGLIDYPSGGDVALTAEGRALADPANPITSVGELHEAWYRMLPNPQASILRALVSIHPDDLPKDELAERVSVSPTSGGYFNNLGRLRTLGAIDYPSGGRARATELLFPAGVPA